MVRLWQDWWIFYSGHWLTGLLIVAPMKATQKQTEGQKMINSLSSEIWINNLNEIFQVISYFDRSEWRWAHKVRVFESGELGRAYWLRDSGANHDGTNFVNMQGALKNAGPIEERLTSREYKAVCARFLRAQENAD